MLKAHCFMQTSHFCSQALALGMIATISIASLQASIYLLGVLMVLISVQAAVDLGLRASDWPEEVEGTYLRMDVPLIVPALLQWLEGQQAGRHVPSSPPPSIPCALATWVLCSPISPISLKLLTSAALQCPRLVPV